MHGPRLLIDRHGSIHVPDKAMHRVQVGCPVLVARVVAADNRALDVDLHGHRVLLGRHLDRDEPEWHSKPDEAALHEKPVSRPVSAAVLTHDGALLRDSLSFGPDGARIVERIVLRAAEKEPVLRDAVLPASDDVAGEIDSLEIGLVGARIVDRE